MANRTGKDLIKQMDTWAVAPGCLAIWWLGQMGVALKGSNQKLIYVDPILTDVVTQKIPGTAGKFERAFDPPVKPEEITNADFVLCTHEHLDHTDPLTLGPLAKASPQARFVTSGWAGDLLDEAGIETGRRQFPKPDQALDLDGVKVWGIPAGHYEVENHPVKGYRWLSFLIDWGDVSFFHSGDTLLYPGYLEKIRSLPKADVALLAANGRDAAREAQDVLGNLLPSEAAWMAAELGWDVLLGGHNDLFVWNTLPPGELINAAYRQKPRQKVHLLQPGELYYYVR
jgi:L-ascorbate metabolism protein UlaG (beta-lactamase superfamily)